MKYLNTPIKLLTVALFLVIVSGHHVFAGSNGGYIYSAGEYWLDDDPIVDFADTRTEHFSMERRDVREAVDVLCYELSIDPFGRSIKQNLNAIMMHPDLTAQERAEVLQLEDLLSYIDHLERRINYLSSKKNLLERQLVGRGHNPITISDQLRNIRDNVSGPLNAPAFDRPRSYDSFSPIAYINSLLETEKATLMARMRSVQVQYQWLKQVRRNPTSLPNGQTIQMASKPDVQLPDGFITVVPKDEVVFSPEPISAPEPVDVVSLEPIEAEDESTGDDQVRAFKKELISLYGELDQLEDRVEQEDVRIEDLSQEVVDLSLKLSEAEILLDERSKTIASLKERLTDVEQRFLLGQKIIQEKDERIAGLRQDLQITELSAGAQKEKLHSIITSKSRQLAELEAFVDAYRNDLIQTRKEIRVKRAYLDQTRKELVALRKQITGGQPNIAPQSASGESIAQSKNAKLVELNGILRIYKDKLSEKNQELIKTQRRLNHLKDELATIKDKISP